MNELRLYTIFHCNLNYSSIEEGQRAGVVNRCYRPLVRLARELRLPVGIEMSGFTLETLARLDPKLVEELRWLLTEGDGELIGSGYSQIIAPLVPAAVNAANLRLGDETYRSLLGCRPRVALVNEQAYSASQVALFLEAGYEAVIMEWENPFRGHPEWEPEWRYLPQYARGSRGGEIPLVWNSSIAFQKFQRYAFGELELDEYMDYLRRQPGEGRRAFPLYGNDVEVFGFRPGRYRTEPTLSGDEWERIRRLFEELLTRTDLRLCRPVEVLELLNERGAGNPLRLETAGQPIPVKKQEKYNISRWAASGRDDVAINTACWRIYQALRKRSPGEDRHWKELCYLWSSDFRTHITDRRWDDYRDRLRRLGEELEAGSERGAFPALSRMEWNTDGWVRPGPHAEVRADGRYLVLETQDLRVRLNCQKGLTVEGAWFKGLSEKPLFGTLPHGYYPDIALGADYFTGHLALRRPGAAQVTTLSPVEPQVDQDAGALVVRAAIETELGQVEQSLRIERDRPWLELRYRLDWPEFPPGSLRVGHVTLNPEAFRKEELHYRTCNGGYETEEFLLSGQRVDHGAVVSYLVSASQGLGLTDGAVEMGDGDLCLRVEVDQTVSALLGLLSYREVQDLFFCRLEFSGLEVDETSRTGKRSGLECCFRITAFPSRGGIPLAGPDTGKARSRANGIPGEGAEGPGIRLPSCCI